MDSNLLKSMTFILLKESNLIINVKIEVSVFLGDGLADETFAM